MQQNGTCCKALEYMVALAILLGVFWLAGCDPSAQPQRSPGLPEVSIVTIQPRKTMLTTELPGRTTPFRIAEIRPQVSGLIQKRLFTEGSDVKAGQVLYQIDPAPFQAALDNATANLSVMRNSADQAGAALKRASPRSHSSGPRWHLPGQIENGSRMRSKRKWFPPASGTRLRRTPMLPKHPAGRRGKGGKRPGGA